MKFTLGEIAQRLGASLEGTAGHMVAGMEELASAQAQELSFAESDKYREAVATSRAGGFIVGPDFPEMADRNLLRCEQPRTAFVAALEMFAPDRTIAGVHPTAVVAEDARIGDGVGIGPGVVIESGAIIGAGTMLRAGCYLGSQVLVGDGCDIGTHVTLLDRVKVGDRCILHPGVVVGSDGYGFQWRGDHHHKIPQIGTVEIGDDVEIGANCCIDRATLGVTRIGSGSKIDNLVQIGHNNAIGRHVLLVSQVGIAGSCKIGNGAVLGGQVGVADHLHIGDGAQIGAQGGVTCDIEPGAKIWGTPSRPMGRVLKEQAALARLPKLVRTIGQQAAALEELKARIAELEKD